MTAAGGRAEAPSPARGLAAQLDFILSPEAARALKHAATWRALVPRAGRRALFAEIWVIDGEGRAMALAPGPWPETIEGRAFGAAIGYRRRGQSRAIPGLTLERAEGAFVAGVKAGRFFTLSLSGAAPVVAEAARALAGECALFAAAGSLASLAARRVLGIDVPRACAPPPLTYESELTTAARCLLEAQATLLRARIETLSAMLAALRLGAPHEAEPVHQTRVALRRLRATIAVFAPLGPPLLAEIGSELRAFGHVLGRAREWDVFETGIAHDLVRRFPADAAALHLAALAGAKRRAAYDGLDAWLAGEAARRLLVDLAVLPLLVHGEGGAALPRTLGAFASAALEKRARRVRRAAALAALEAEPLHRLRLDAKHLRYLGEMFAPCFSSRRSARFIRRLAALQDWLGALNDAAMTARLMHDIAHEGGDGGETGGEMGEESGAEIMARARGMALGFAAAVTPRAMSKAVRALERLQGLKPFWL